MRCPKPAEQRALQDWRGPRERHCACAPCGQPSLTLHLLPTVFHYSAQTQHGPWENCESLARVRPLLPMLAPQVSRSPSGTGVGLGPLRVLLVPRVPGRRAAGGGRGLQEKGRERLAAEAGRVGAWRAAGKGGRPGGLASSCAYMPRNALWKEKGSGGEPGRGKPGDEKLLVRVVRGEALGWEEPLADPPGRFPVALRQPGTFLKCGRRRVPGLRELTAPSVGFESCV